MMENKKEKISLLNEFSNLEKAKDKINKWIEEDYHKQDIYSASQYKNYEEFEKANYKSLL